MQFEFQRTLTLRPSSRRVIAFAAMGSEECFQLVDPHLAVEESVKSLSPANTISCDPLKPPRKTAVQVLASDGILDNPGLQGQAPP